MKNQDTCVPRKDASPGGLYYPKRFGNDISIEIGNSPKAYRIYELKPLEEIKGSKKTNVGLFKNQKSTQGEKSIEKLSYRKLVQKKNIKSWEQYSIEVAQTKVKNRKPRINKSDAARFERNGIVVH